MSGYNCSTQRREWTFTSAVLQQHHNTRYQQDVEIYNKTNQFIDIKNLWIGNRNEAAQIDNFYAFAQNGYMLLPKSYYAITTNAEILKSQPFFIPKNEFFILL